MRILAIGLLAVVACSHPAKSPHNGGGNGSGDPGPDAGGLPVAPADASAPSPVTREECDKLIDHVLDLMSKADNTPEDRAKAHAKMAEEFLEPCLTLDRPGFDCMLAAPDQATFSACGEQ